MILGWLLVCGVGIVLVGTLLSAWPRSFVVGLALQAVGVAAVGLGGFAVMAAGDALGGEFSGSLHPAIGVDPLSGFFLGVLGLVAAPALAYGCDYLRGMRHACSTAVAGGIFVLALIGVLVARDAVGFLLMWELMSIAPAVTILLLSRRSDAIRTVLVYLGLTHLAGVGVWVSMLTLAHVDAFGPGGLASLPASSRSWLAFAAVVGFGTKAGLMPLHTWLVRAHPAAPSHVSAVMSGMMIKVALYGLIRMLFEWLDPLPSWVAPTLFALAVLSCLGGALYAVMQRDLKRILAFSSVENVGIIVLGLSTSLLADRAGSERVAGLAFAAAMLHTLNHGLFKSLLFLCVGSFQRRLGTADINSMGGLLRVMPITGASFLVGAMAIAGVPILNGFASEWLTMQGMLQLAIGGSGWNMMLGVLGVAVLAATAALALFCFVNVTGHVLLGAHRQRAAADAQEVSRWMTMPVIALATGCVAVGVAPGLVLDSLSSVSPYMLGPEFAGGVLDVSGSGVFAPLPAALLVVGVVVVLQMLRRRGGVAAPAPMWNCGQVLQPRLAWTSAGFTKSLRLVLEVVLRTRRSVQVDRDPTTGVQAVRHESEVPHLFDEWIYRPITGGSVAASRMLLRIQSGSLRLYLAYLVGTLFVGLAIVRIAGGS